MSSVIIDESTQVLNQALIDASQEGNIEKVQECLTDGADILYRDVEKGGTSLHWASKKGHLAYFFL